MKFFKYILIVTVLAGLTFSGCDLTRTPHDAQSAEEALGSLEGLKSATLGNYQGLKGQGSDYHFYIKHVFDMSDFRSDDVQLTGSTTDPLFYAYNYSHDPTMGNAERLWRVGYQIIYGANRVIAEVEPGESEVRDQLLGENKFLRAMVHFQLVTFFGRPYPQNPDALGIPIMKEPNVDAQPPRSTVGEVYNFVASELQEAADLMNEDKTSSYASKEVAEALLSRVYLYMEENESAIDYANKVIESGRYELVDTESLPEYFTIDNEDRSESVFAVRHEASDDHGNGHLASMYRTSPGGAGWGEMVASPDYRELVNEHPDDVRSEFIEPNYETDEDGNIVTDENGDPVVQTRNGFPLYYITKFSNLNGQPTNSSPEVIRYVEMFLNRAEANAKLGNDQAAIDDVNMIRQRAGLSGDALYSTGDLQGHNSVLDVVLEERRLELAWESHRGHDLFRNGRTLQRDYNGTHLNPSYPGVNMSDSTQTIPADHPRAIYFIPETEIDINPNLEQNPFN